MGAMSNYSAPSKDASDDSKIGWANEAVQEAESWLKTQRASRDWDQSIDLLSGDDMAPISADAPDSDVKIGLTKRIAREQVAGITNLRFASSYRTDLNEYDKHAAVLNTVSTAWYVNTFADRSLKTGYQYAAGMGTGYVSPVWDPEFHSKRRGDIRLNTFGPRDVLPIQLPQDHDLQRAYAVGLKTEMPINLARSQWYKRAGDIVPDRDAPNFLAKGLAKVQKFISPALRVGNTSREKERDAGFPTVDLFAFYIDDPSVNLSDHEISMGEPNTSWHYMVPRIGDDIPANMYNAAGQMLYRKATEQDAKLYPLRRLLICTRTAVLYDNTSYWWHGMVPIVRLCFDKWPWDALGYGVARDTGPIERSVNRVYRAIDNSANVRLAPPLQFDENVVSRGLMETINMRAPGEEVAINLALGEAIKPILPADYYNIPAEIAQYPEKLRELALWLTGNKDLQAAAKAKQIPAGDTLEKLLELAGPLAADMARDTETAIAQLGVLNKALFFQFYSTKRRIQIAGKNGETNFDFDYDPGNMVPSHMKGEKVDEQSRFSLMQRARDHVDNFYYWVNPKSMHQMTSMSRRLMLLQLLKLQFPVDPWTIAKAFDFDDDFGPAPEGTSNMIERWRAWRVMALEEKIEEAQLMQSAGLGEPGKGAGRPPSGNKPPRQVSKDGGTRTTIAQS